MERNGWRLLFHRKIDEQLRRLVRARNRARRRGDNANTRLLDALARAESEHAGFVNALPMLHNR